MTALLSIINAELQTMTDPGLYSHTHWEAGWQFIDRQSRAPRDMSGVPYLAEAYNAAGELVFTWKSSGADSDEGTIDLTRASAEDGGYVVPTATETQHDGIPAGRYIVHLYDVTNAANRKWRASALMDVGSPGSQSTVWRSLGSWDGAAAVAIVPGAKGDKGDQGDPGAHFKGTWDNGTAYGEDDVVGYGPALYLAVAASTNVPPGTDPSKWELLLAVPTNAYRGEWDGGTAYVATDMVRWAGALWYAKAASTAVEPGSDPSKWEQMIGSDFTTVDEAGTSLAINAANRGLAHNFLAPTTTTVLFAKTLPKGANGIGKQVGTGQVVLTAEAGATLENFWGYDRTLGQKAEFAWRVTDNSDGSSAVISVSGDLTS